MPRGLAFCVSWLLLVPGTLFQRAVLQGLLDQAVFDVVHPGCAVALGVDKEDQISVVVIVVEGKAWLALIGGDEVAKLVIKIRRALAVPRPSPGNHSLDAMIAAICAGAILILHLGDAVQVVVGAGDGIAVIGDCDDTSDGVIGEAGDCAPINENGFHPVCPNCRYHRAHLRGLPIKAFPLSSFRHLHAVNFTLIQSPRRRAH